MVGVGGWMEGGRVPHIRRSVAFSCHRWVIGFSVMTSLTQLSSPAGRLGGGGLLEEHSVWRTTQPVQNKQTLLWQLHPELTTTLIPSSHPAQRSLLIEGPPTWALSEPDELSHSEGILTKPFYPRLQSLCHVVSLFDIIDALRGEILADFLKLRTPGLESVSFWEPDILDHVPRSGSFQLLEI